MASLFIHVYYRTSSLCILHCILPIIPNTLLYILFWWKHHNNLRPYLHISLSNPFDRAVPPQKIHWDLHIHEVLLPRGNHSFNFRYFIWLYMGSPFIQQQYSFKRFYKTIISITIYNNEYVLFLISIWYAETKRFQWSFIGY